MNVAIGVIRTLTFDHCWATENALNACIQQALRAINQLGLTIQCWVHVERNVRKRLVEEGYNHKTTSIGAEIMTMVYDLHFCRSQEMFDAYTKLVLEWLSRRGYLGCFAQWFKKFYLTPPWNAWFYKRSGIIGVDANNNPIESAWEGTQASTHVRMHAHSKMVMCHVSHVWQYTRHCISTRTICGATQMCY